MRGASSSGSARLGIHSSPYSSTRSSTFGPRPPMRTGGCGFWTGFGHDQIGSKSTNSPWNSASSFVQISFMARMRSRMSAKRRFGSVPWLAHLLAVPAAADAELEAPAGEEVERGDLLGGGDRVALDDQADAGADPQLRRGLRDGGQRHERVVRVPVLLRQLAAARVRRVAGDRDVRVLGEEQRLEAGVLGGSAELARARSSSRWGRSSGRISRPPRRGPPAASRTTERRGSASRTWTAVPTLPALNRSPRGAATSIDA